MTKIRDLAPGTRFRYPELNRTAVLVGLGPSGARVVFEGSKRTVEFEARRPFEEGTDVVAFEAPGKPILVSDYSDVEVTE